VSHQISKQTLKHDEFSESMMTVVDFAKRHATEVLAVAVGALIIVVGLALSPRTAPRANARPA